MYAPLSKELALGPTGALFCDCKASAEESSVKRRDGGGLRKGSVF
jgi:hypothetical protein